MWLIGAWLFFSWILITDGSRVWMTNCLFRNVIYWVCISPVISRLKQMMFLFYISYRTLTMFVGVVVLRYQHHMDNNFHKHSHSPLTYSICLPVYYVIAISTVCCSVIYKYTEKERMNPNYQWTDLFLLMLYIKTLYNIHDILLEIKHFNLLAVCFNLESTVVLGRYI